MHVKVLQLDKHQTKAWTNIVYPLVHPSCAYNRGKTVIIGCTRMFVKELGSDESAVKKCVVGYLVELLQVPPTLKVKHTITTSKTPQELAEAVWG